MQHKHGQDDRANEDIVGEPGTPISTMPLRMARSMKTPTMVPRIVPRPPVSAVPPTTTIAMTSSS